MNNEDIAQQFFVQFFFFVLRVRKKIVNNYYGKN